MQHFSTELFALRDLGTAATGADKGLKAEPRLRCTGSVTHQQNKGRYNTENHSTQNLDIVACRTETTEKQDGQKTSQAAFPLQFTAK